MWFVYDPEDGLTPCETKSHAMAVAANIIESYRDKNRMEWIDGVERIMVFQCVAKSVDASQCAEDAAYVISEVYEKAVDK